MELNLYQYKAREFALDSAYDPNYLFPGLAAEAGEVCGKYAKLIRDVDQKSLSSNRENVIFINNIEKELGDVLWFVALIGDYYGITLNDIGHGNITKLTKRKEANTITGSGDER